MDNQTQTVLKVAGTRISASWLCFTNFVNLNTGRIDVVKRAWPPRPDTKEGDWYQIKAKPMEYHYRSTIKYETTTNGQRKLVGIWVGTVRQVTSMQMKKLGQTR